MIIDEIKKQNIEALKAKDQVKRTALSVVINKYMLANLEAKAQGKEFVDADMVQILQKTVKELAEEAENYKKVGNDQVYNETLTQKSIVESFLPQMMSIDAIRAEIEKLDDKSIGSVMKHFKLNFAGKCDMRDVQSVLKTL